MAVDPARFRGFFRKVTTGEYETSDESQQQFQTDYEEFFGRAPVTASAGTSAAPPQRATPDKRD
jgi:hypothetical protein